MSGNRENGLMTGGLMIGLDVGSTTVKAVVMDPETDQILWQDYQRHETKQPEKVSQFLERIEAEFPLRPEQFRIFITGSGGSSVSSYIGAKFVQEVNAVSLAVEKLYPDAGSVIELGGQDAKIIIWIEDSSTGQRRKQPSMNDKCAGGTGAVIDKINAKLRMSTEELQALPYHGVRLHPVAGKCGVFAETDINGLQKQGVPPTELMPSLFEAIVQQNLSVLTRGNTLRPKVLLLGGPNTYIPAMRECWRNNIPKVWEERKFPLPEGVDPADLIIVPENAQYYAAIGSVLYGKSEEPDVGVYKGRERLVHFIEKGRVELRAASGERGLVKGAEELDEFLEKFKKEPFEPAKFQPGQVVEAFIGIDGGSTSTKAVALDRHGTLLCKSYQLSKGNPIQDAKEVLGDLRRLVEEQGAILDVKGVGTTGYAKDMLKETLGADVALVETVAHTQAALKYYDNVDVIVDVGGQDIKVIVLKDGKVKDFKLNTQCSAGNGYFLQSTSQRFGHPITQFAELAFKADKLPTFSYGCAVFMETDIVNFQQLGWSAEEIMAGLAHVLPKNIWLYVVQEPNLAKFGKKFVLQGGTQHNMAAVKAQYDFIRSKVPGVEVVVHRFCGESGAIGAALDAIRVVGEAQSAFIQLDAAMNLQFSSKRDESTRCSFCKNKCLRTFIDTVTPGGEERRFIIATCEKGEVENIDDMKVIKARLDSIKKANPNMVEFAGKRAFKSFEPQPVGPEMRLPKSNGLLGRLSRKKSLEAAQAEHEGVMQKRRGLRVGMPRVLNMYSLAPFFTTYIEALGVQSQNILFSDYTDEKMYKEGSRRGSIDQCFPSKVAIAHVHNLLYKKEVDLIFFPTVVTLPSFISHSQDAAACPTVAATPNVCKAAFTKEGDLFGQMGKRYADPQFHMREPNLLHKEMFDFWSPILDVTEDEHRYAMGKAYEALQRFAELQLEKGREVLAELEASGRVGVVLLGRPYHNDPGLNHEILEEIQKKGFPIFTVESLPRDPEILDRLFGEDVRMGMITDPMDIRDVWKNCYSENTNRKVWGAKYVARHPNLVCVDLSSFKCGHDAPIYNVIEGIIEATLTPYFTFHDIDENKPTGSIKIRVETMDYFLKRYQERLQGRKEAMADIEAKVRAYEEELRHKLGLLHEGQGEAEPEEAPEEVEIASATY